jgi:hypothetical protein
VGTGLGGDGDDVVRWQERIYWQWHHALLDRAGEAGTVGEHDQHSIGGCTSSSASAAVTAAVWSVSLG